LEVVEKSLFAAMIDLANGKPGKEVLANILKENITERPRIFDSPSLM